MLELGVRKQVHRAEGRVVIESSGHPVPPGGRVGKRILRLELAAGRALEGPHVLPRHVVDVHHRHFGEEHHAVGAQGRAEHLGEGSLHLAHVVPDEPDGIRVVETGRDVRPDAGGRGGSLSETVGEGAEGVFEHIVLRALERCVAAQGVFALERPARRPDLRCLKLKPRSWTSSGYATK